jgi:hypothetical protein
MRHDAVFGVLFAVAFAAAMGMNTGKGQSMLTRALTIGLGLVAMYLAFRTGFYSGLALIVGAVALAEISERLWRRRKVV